MTTQAMTKPEAGIETIRALLEKNKSQLTMALPKHLSVDRLLRIAMTAIQRNPKLLECHPATLGGAVLTCAIWGVEPIGPGGAWLVPFWNSKKGRTEVQFIIDYRGLVRIARNSGDVLKIEPRAVHAKDTFSYSYGTSPAINHTPYQGQGTAGELTHVYAVAFYRDGATQFVVLTKDMVEQARNASKAKDAGPWQTHYEDMALKTAVRRICKQLPMDPEKQDLISREERGDVGLPQDLGTLVDPDEQPTDAEIIDDEPPIPMPQAKPKAEEKPEPQTENVPKTESARLISEAQRKRFYAICKSTGKTEDQIKSKLFEEIGSESTKDITVDHYEALCAWGNQK